MKTFITILLLLSFAKQSQEQPVWNFQNSGTTSNLNDICLKSVNGIETLFIVGDNGTMLRSTNLGLLWETVNSNTTLRLMTINFLSNSDTGYAAGENGIVMTTTDGGINWNTMQSNTTNTIRDLKTILGNVKAVAVGDNSTFLKLENNLWTYSTLDTVSFNSIKTEVSGIVRLVIVGNNGTILKTSNSGTNWRHIYSGVTDNLNSIADNGIVGDNGVALTYVSGDSATAVANTGTNNNLRDILNARIYYDNYSACGANGTVLKQWYLLNTNTQMNFNSIIRTTYDIYFVVGENGAIIFTNSFLITPNAQQLNSNNISSWYTNNGKFNHHPFTSNAGFEWPRNGNKFQRYISGISIGAVVDSVIRVTVCNYDSEFWPGQTINGIPEGQGTPDFKIYKLIFNANDADRSIWPNTLLGNSDQGAPVYFDSLTSSWKASDYGNQTMFYSYTDSYVSSHQGEGRTAPLIADVKQINFSFNQPEELKNIIYQEYRIINRSSDVWTNTYINLFSDDDLGDPWNDAGGVDTNLSLSYIYNLQNTDPSYGSTPPATGFTIIRGPLTYTGSSDDTVAYYEGKRNKIKVGYKEMNLSSTINFRGNQPNNYLEYYYTLEGLNTNGSPYINPVSGQETRFVYSGDPVTSTGWNQDFSGDMKFYQSFGPLNMNHGDTQVIVIAQVIARGSSNLNSITKLRETSQTAKEYYDNFFEDVVIGINNITTSTPDDFILYQNYPNPFNPSTVINYQLPSSAVVHLKVYDALGKEVMTLVNEKQNAGKYSVTFNGSNLSSGIYFYKISINNFVATKKMLLVK